MGFAGRLVERAARRVRPPAPLPRIPWFDEPDAGDHVAALAGSEGERELLRSWVDHGYAVVEGLVPHDLIDEMLGDLDALFTAEHPVPGLMFHDLQIVPDHPAVCSHAELLRTPVDERVAARDRSSWRTHGFFEHSRAADRIRELHELRRLASLVLGVPSRATYSINFRNGSSQLLHEDSAVFHLGVPNLICGAWVACEDVVAGSGPLVYCPGSHRRPMYAAFEGYPMANLRTADAATFRAYHDHVAADAERFERRTFLARKGDVLLWHGMLVHGGEPIREPGATRRSYVLHFIPDGADVAGQVTGHTNW